MDEYESLSHSKWECKYHVVFIPKCRRKVLYGAIAAVSRGGVPSSWQSRRRAGSRKGICCRTMCT